MTSVPGSTQHYEYQVNDPPAVLGMLLEHVLVDLYPAALTAIINVVTTGGKGGGSCSTSHPTPASAASLNTMCS